MADRSHKLLLLEGLRGTAACIVLCYHLRVPAFPHAYLAVDLFFMLSGFVICLAYQERLDRGWRVRDFLAVRFARLYPLYALALLLGFALVAYHAGTDAARGLSLAQAGSALLLGLVFVPRPLTHLAGAYLFPLNIPLWSLMFEVLANVGHGVLLRRRRTRDLLGIAAVAGGCLAWQAFRHGGLDVGARLDSLSGGVARVTFGYVSGMILYRLWTRDRDRFRVPAWTIVVALVAGLACPVNQWWYDAFTVICLMPCLLLLSASANTPRVAARLCAELGMASYAIYVLHAPLLGFARGLLVHVHLYLPAISENIFSGTVVLAAAVLADRLYDTRARALLKRWLTRRLRSSQRQRGVTEGTVLRPPEPPVQAIASNVSAS